MDVNSRSTAPSMNWTEKVSLCELVWTCLSLFLSTSGSTGGGSDRPGDIKDDLGMENLHLNDHPHKASKTQVCGQFILFMNAFIFFKHSLVALNSSATEPQQAHFWNCMQIYVEKLPAVSVHQLLSRQQTEWACPSCTFINKLSRPGCEICATARPDIHIQQVRCDIPQSIPLYCSS